MSALLLHHIGTMASPYATRQVHGIVFDMDGTLIHEGIDYVAMRAALGMPYPLDVIAEIEKLPDTSKQQAYVNFVFVAKVCPFS